MRSDALQCLYLVLFYCFCSFYRSGLVLAGDASLSEGGGGEQNWIVALFEKYRRKEKVKQHKKRPLLTENMESGSSLTG